MNYWLTTHWPPFEDHIQTAGIWFQARHQDLADLVRPRDKVIVYEGITRVSYTAQNGRIYQSRRPGHGGIAWYGTVTAPSGDSGVEPRDYDQRGVMHWSWFAPVRVTSCAGYLPRVELCDILRRPRSYTFHGFGEEHSGSMRIPREQFDEIVRRFHQRPE